MNIVKFLLLLQLFAVAIVSTAAQSSDSPSSRKGEQTVFSAESPTVDHPVLIPQTVLTALAMDPMVRRRLQYEHISDTDLPASWFSAARVQLSDQQSDLVIVAPPPLMGANVTSFWVFHAVDHGYSLLLFASAHDLIILKSVRMGFHDLELTGETSQVFTTTTYRYNGIHYAVHRQRSHLLP